MNKLCLAGTIIAMVGSVAAQEDNERPQLRPPSPPVVSPELNEDRGITFRLRAEVAKAVRLDSSDLPGLPFGRGPAMTKDEEGVWTVTVGPIVPGAYRYHFDVDGVRVLDPVNTATSESNRNIWSLAVVPGSERFDTRDVPHGAVAEVTYQSKSLGRSRRMHIYTPPGYETGDEVFPVLYLLHGAFDCDDSWTTVGRAGFILDNLIAAAKAKPMVIVMPTGHTSPFSFGPPNAIDEQVDAFVTEFIADVRPFVENRYRVRGDRAGRAIAGLSMGGAQTLEIAIRQLDQFSHIGVFSSGVFSLNARGPVRPGPSWEERYETTLNDAELKSGLKLVWFAIGKDDFLIETARGTVKVLRGHDFDVDFFETEGGHTWLNWRNYLSEFTPLLFQDSKSDP